MKMLIFAGTYEEYRHLMQDNDIPYLHTEWLYVSEVHKILGCLRNTPYILYGSWYNRDDYRQFQKLAEGKGFVQVAEVT